MRRGFTLVECAVAGAILSVSALAFMQGVAVATHIARDNAQLLAADGVAWDAAWKTFNENFDNIPLGKTVETLTESAAPSLYLEDSEAVLTMNVTSMTLSSEVGGKDVFYVMKTIAADVEWGPPDRRKKLSDYHNVFLYRSDLRRVTW